MSALAVEFHWPSFWEAWGPISDGMRITVELTLLAMALGCLLALGVALLRVSGSRVARGIGATWVELWRSTPLLLQIYWFFYVMPATFDIGLSPFATGLFGLTCNVSAYLAETFRAGIVSIRSGQRHAALALGMTTPQAYVRVVLPQALWRVLPATANTWVSLFKDTALVSAIAVADMSYKALELRTRNFRTLEVLTALALAYLLLGYPQAKLADWLHRRFAVVE